MATVEELEDTKYFPPLLKLGVKHRADTVVTTHVDGVAYFGAIADVLKTMGGPGDRLYITSWNLEPTLRPLAGESDLTERLLSLAAAGADVRLIVAVPRYSLGPQGQSPISPDYWRTQRMKLGIADVARVNIASVRALRSTPRNGPPPLEKRVLVDWGGGNDSRHEKCTIAYSATTGELHTFVGGLDFQPDRFADERHLGAPAVNWWHDGGIQLQGGAADAVLDNFWTRWVETETLPARRYWFGGIAELFNPAVEPKPPQLKPPTSPLPGSTPAGSHSDAGVRIWRSYASLRVEEVLRDGGRLPWHTLPPTGVVEVSAGLVSAIDAAKRFIYVEDQTLNPSLPARVYNHHQVLFPVIAAACATDVKVIFVTQGYPGPGALAPWFDATPDMSTEIHALILDDLTVAQRRNFALFYLRDTKVHSKLVLVDDEFVSIGSANLWDRSQDGTESEVTAAVVHPGGSASLVADLRVQLWREHLRTSPTPAADAKLRDLGVSLGYFRTHWGTGTSGDIPNSALVEMPQ